MAVAETSVTMSAPERRSVLTLCLLYISRMLGLFMVLPIFAIYLPLYEGFSVQGLGLALGIYGLTQAMLQLPFGLWSDKIGRKPIILFGLCLFAIGSVIAALANSIEMIILGRALQGAGAISSTIMALVADVTREETRSKAMAMVGASIGLSFAIAMVAGPKIAVVHGLDGVFWLTAFLAILGILLVIWFVPSPKQVQPTEALPISGMLKRVLSDSQLIRFDLGIFCLHLVLTSAFVVVPGLLSSILDLSPEQHGFAYLFILGGAFIVMLPIMISAEKMGKVHIAFIGAILLMAVASACLFFAYSQAIIFIVAWFLFFIGFNLLEALLPSLLSRQVFPGGKGTAMGVYSTCQFSGVAVGGVTGGWVASYYGSEGVFLFVVTVLVLWFVVALGMKAPPKAKTLTLKYTSNFSSDMILKELNALLGVMDVVVIEKEHLAYIKVNPQEFEVSQLKAFSI